MRDGVGRVVFYKGWSVGYFYGKIFHNFFCIFNIIGILTLSDLMNRYRGYLVILITGHSLRFFA